MRSKTNIVLLALLLIATSCASRKKSVISSHPQPFEWITTNMDIQAEGNDMVFNDLSGQLRIRKDSIVWLSVTATIGVEVLRAKISNDSVWLLNRLEKTYLSEPLDTVSVCLGLPLSLPLIQTLLLDNKEGFPPVENQTVQLKTFIMGNWSAKIKYNNVKINEKTTFPLRITDKMERIQVQKMKGL